MVSHNQLFILGCSMSIFQLNVPSDIIVKEVSCFSPIGLFSLHWAVNDVSFSSNPRIVVSLRWFPFISANGDALSTEIWLTSLNIVLHVYQTLFQKTCLNQTAASSQLIIFHWSQSILSIYWYTQLQIQYPLKTECLSSLVEQ